MSHLKSYRLPSFTLTVRECTEREWKSVDKARDAVAVMIRHKSGDLLEMVVQSPVYGSWNEDKAARSAISFASSPSSFDAPSEIEWCEKYGEDLTNEAFCHGVLGKEMRLSMTRLITIRRLGLRVS